MDKQVTHAEHISLQKNISMLGGEQERKRSEGGRRGKMKAREGLTAVKQLKNRREGRLGRKQEDL